MNALDRRTPPPVHPFGHMELPPERVTTLANGTRVHVTADPSCPIARICIVGEGGKDEAPAQALAAVAAKLLPEGSALYDSDTTADMMDFRGASLHGNCTDHFTRLDLSVPSASLAGLLPVFFALVREPRFPDGRLESVKSQLAAQCAYYRSRVDDIAAKAAFNLIAGPDSPQVRFAEPDDFAAVTRENVLRRLALVFRARGIHVFLSGGITPELERAVCAMAETFAGGDVHPLDVVPFAPRPPQTVHVPHPGAEQCAVQVMIPTIPRSHPDYLPLRFAVTALGGFFGSRLMQNIREEKGLTYGITSSLCGVREGSYIDISAQCAPQYAERLLDELRAELRAMATRPLSDDELLRTRLYEQTRLAGSLDNAIATGDHYITSLIVGMPDDYFSRQEKVTADITAAQIADVSARYLDADNMRTVIVGLD